MEYTEQEENMKHISVIIPCYNAAPFIDRCIQSLLNQTIGIENLELIFVNDASTDNTLDILMQYEAQYENDIMIINCEQNGRQGTARNIGMLHATCDYIGFIDADDWIDISMFEKLYSKALELNCDMVGCLCDRVSSINDITPLQNNGNDRYFVITNDNERNLFLAKGIGPHIVCKLYKKSIIFDNNIFFPEKLTYEDNYWGCLINYYVNSAYMIDEVLYHWFINPNSTSLERNQIHHFDRFTIEEMKINSYKERGLYERYYKQIAKEFIQIYYFNSLHTIFSRFDEFPIYFFKQMQDNIKKNIPDYKTIIPYTEKGKVLIQLIEMDMTQEDLNAIHKMYLKTFVKQP